MKTGGVVVDLAAEQGGNCAVTEPETVCVKHGVTIIGYTDMTSRLAAHASQFFATNLTHLLDDMGKHDGFQVDLEDIVVRKALVAHAGEVTWPCPPEVEEKARVAAQPPKPKVEATVEAHKAAPPAETGSSRFVKGFATSVAGIAALFGIGLYAPPEFMQHFTVFVLSCFIGWQVIWNVTPALHTPLMSVTNAISGIIIVGGILQASTGAIDLATILGAVAVLVASINIAGGFLVTQRMLAMFRKEA
jgi:NAD(P) transhydrogenase subunit alpha